MAEIVSEGSLQGWTPAQLEDTTSPSLAQTTLGESLGATVENTWNSLPTIAAARSNLRTMGQQAFDPDAPIQPGTGFEFDQGPAVKSEDANARVKQQGSTLTPFTHDVGENTLSGLIDDNLKRNRNDEIISRSAGGILNGSARFATSALVSLFDPVNDMAMVIPVAPEAFAAARIASLGGGLGARAAVRGVEGAAQGAVGMGALQGIQVGQDAIDHETFSIGEALREVMIGGVLGGVGGAFHGAVSPRTADAVSRASMARVMTDDPRGVDIKGLLDHADASEAADRLTTWQRQQERINADRERLPTSPPEEAVIDRGAEIATHEERLGQLREQSRQLFREAEDVRASRVGVNNQDAVFNRLDAIEHRLSQGLPGAERATLEAERAQIQAGGDVLAHERSVAQEAGLRSAAGNSAARALKTEGHIARLRDEDRVALEQADRNRASADRTTRIQQAKIDSREQVLQDLMAKEVHRYAFRQGVALGDGEAATAAREIRLAHPAELADTIASHLNAIAERSDAFPVRDALAGIKTDPIMALRAEAVQAAGETAARATTVTDRELVQAQRSNKALIESAPKYEGEVSKDLAEVNERLAELKAQYDTEVAAGRMAEHPSLGEAGKLEAELGEGKAAYAMCARI